jgi:hypothetical protein
MRLRRSTGGKVDAGYAVLLAIFMVATMLLLAAAATPNIITQGRRLREQEAIWRGNQYVRAIRLYYQKNGKYPASLEDLSKPNAVGVHFLRKTYREPMNSSDGSWRLIYVTPAGQLVGSVHYHNLQEMAVAAAFAGQSSGSVAGMASQLFGQVNPAPNGGGQLGTTGQPSAQPSQNGLQPGQSGQQGLGGQNSLGSIFSSSQPAPLAAADSPVFGGSVIGVASKMKQSSITVYQGGKTYFEWEFIWNPLMNANGGAPGQIAIPGLNAPGQLGALPNPAALPGGANGPSPAPGNMPISSPFGSPGVPGSQTQPMPSPAPQN